MADLFIGQPVQRPYCTLEGGHFWCDSDACVVCGQSWDALNEIVVEQNPDGSVSARVVARELI